MEREEQGGGIYQCNVPNERARCWRQGTPHPRQLSRGRSCAPSRWMEAPGCKDRVARRPQRRCVATIKRQKRQGCQASDSFRCQSTTCGAACQRKPVKRASPATHSILSRGPLWRARSRAGTQGRMTRPQPLSRCPWLQMRCVCARPFWANMPGARRKRRALIRAR